MEESVYILHEGKRPFIIFIRARRLDVRISVAASRRTGLITGKQLEPSLRSFQMEKEENYSHFLA